MHSGNTGKIDTALRVGFRRETVLPSFHPAFVHRACSHKTTHLSNGEVGFFDATRVL